MAVLLSPQPFDECLRWEGKRASHIVLQAIRATCLSSEECDSLSDELQLKQVHVLYPEEFRLYPDLVLLRNQLHAASYNLQTLQTHDDSYRSRYVEVDAALKGRGWDNPIPFENLLQWDTYAKNNLKTAPFRKEYLKSIFSPLLQRLLSSPAPTLAQLREPTGWDRVDRALRLLHRSLATARHEEDFQAIGLTCREVLISVGQAVYDKEWHGAVDGVLPSNGDGARMIEGFLNHAAGGDSNAKLRKHAKASMDLAVELQHKRAADFRAAALCLEATVSVVNIVSILSGRPRTF